jgi:HlyD family secretion protein
MGATTSGRWRVWARWLVRAFKLAALAAVAGGLVYWFRFAPVPVSVHQVERGEIVAEVMGTGTLEARYTSTISPKISGRLQEVLADQGDRVEAGQVLLRLDDAELKQQVEMAQATVAGAQAALVRLEADRAQAVAVLAQAESDAARTEKLAETNVSTAADVDKAREALGIARAGISRSDAALAEGQQQVVIAEKTLAYQRARLADTVVVAPMAGLIVQRQRDPGDIVVPGSPVLSLVATEELWITAWVDETEMSRVAEGQTARVAFRSEPEQAYRGQVARLGREADRETREFIVDVRVLELPKNWAVGQRAEVYIETARKTGVTVLPAQTILWRDEQPGVYVRRDQYAVWRALTLGLAGREIVEVASGLQPGEWVVIPAGAKQAALDGRRIAVP